MFTLQCRPLWADCPYRCGEQSLRLTSAGLKTILFFALVFYCIVRYNVTYSKMLYVTLNVMEEMTCHTMILGTMWSQKLTIHLI